jgi:hypothetical protein
MGTIILKYPEDPTGINPNNLVINEPHDLGPARNRAFVPNYGSYFTESMIVTEASTGRVLTKGVHYIAAQLQQDATLAMDKEICAVVVVTDPDVLDSLLFTYQVVGGVFSTSASALAKMIENLDIDERAVEWGSVIGIPSAFPPAPHLHDIGDLYGFEYLVEALDALRNAILIGDEAAHDELRQFINYQDGLLQAALDDLRSDFETHENNKANPHAVTKLQVGLGQVQDYGIATTAEAQAGTVNNKYMTPLLTSQAITQLALIPLNNHIADKTNPHATTKAQVGLALVENYQPATQAEAEAGTRSDRYLTPLTTKQAITFQALVPLNTHINDQTNPHNTTKLQVGLGSVQDYAIANQAEAEIGTSNLKYMTPLRTANAIATQALVPLTTHINNVNNPHATTKAQVGLGSVDNYATATTAEAQVGAVNTKFMTPLLTAQAITQQAVTPLNNHINNLSNPHQVSKSQVGLSQIPNAITASRAFNSDAALLTAKGMYDHTVSADHDARYAPKNTAGVDCSVHWNGSGVYVWGGGTWRQIWPAQWS